VQVRLQAAAFVLAVTGVVVLVTAGNAPAATPVAPSAHCHVVDGSFTLCPDGSAEWSDVPVRDFSQTSSHLYADQADLDPNLAGPGSPADTFELMCDECWRTTPLAPGEYFLITFDTVEPENGKQELRRYAIHVFADGTANRRRRGDGDRLHGRAGGRDRRPRHDGRERPAHCLRRRQPRGQVHGDGRRREHAGGARLDGVRDGGRTYTLTYTGATPPGTRRPAPPT
jgi:hypothetical protein